MEKPADALVQEILARAQAALQSAPPPVRPAYGPLHRAAAVLASYDPATLRPAFNDPGAPPAAGAHPDAPAHHDVPVPWTAEDEAAARAALAADSDELPPAQEGAAARREMQAPVRRAVLAELGGPAGFAAALAANPDRLQDGLQTIFEQAAQGSLPPLDSLPGAGCAGLLLVSDWLDPTLYPIPPAEDVRRRLDYLALLEPFEQLAGLRFAGRQAELEMLRGYVGVLGPEGTRAAPNVPAQESAGDVGDTAGERPPLVIYGPGGLGKSALLARFILDHASLSGQEKLAWAYLDFDRAALRPQDPVTLLLEAVRQLGLQYPHAAANADAIRAGWLDRMERSAVRTPRSAAVKRAGPAPRGGGRTRAPLSPSEQKSLLYDFRAFLNHLRIAEDPLLFVLDTFEQAQLRGGEVVEDLLAFIILLQDAVPRVRIVIAGRAPVREVSEQARRQQRAGVPTPAPGEPPLLQYSLPPFDPAAARELLAARGVEPATAAWIADHVVGTPLALALAATLLAPREGAAAEDDERAALEAEVGAGPGGPVEGALVEGILYRRLLGRVHPDVRPYAFPGLLLRRVTPEIIVQVMAPAGELPPPSEAEAQALYNRMRGEISLAYEENGVLRHRSDVRLITLRLPPQNDAERRRIARIHRLAADYYANQTGPTARAEELYHLLALQRPTAELDAALARGEPDADSLYSALDELGPAGRAWLKTHVLNQRLDAEERRAAGLESWEREAAAAAEALLADDTPAGAERALARLAERRGEPGAAYLPGSRLYALEARALARLGRDAELLALAAEGAAFAPPQERGLLYELALAEAGGHRRRGDPNAALDALARAEAAAAADAPDALPLRRTAISLARLEVNADDSAALAALDEALAATGDGALAAAPRLAGAAAARLAVRSPAAVWRIVGLVVPTHDTALCRALGLALAGWDREVSAAKRTPDGRRLEGDGVLARRCNVPERGGLDESWAAHITDLPPAELQALLLRLIEEYRAAPPAVVQAAAALLLPPQGAAQPAPEQRPPPAPTTPGPVTPTPLPQPQPVVEETKPPGRGTSAAQWLRDALAAVARTAGAWTAPLQRSAPAGSAKGESNTPVKEPVKEPAQEVETPAPPAALPRRLDAAGSKRLREALAAAFTRREFARLVEEALQVRVEAVSLAGSYTELLFQVIQEMERRGQTGALVAAALNARPADPALRAVAAELGLVAEAGEQDALAAFVAASGSVLDVAAWRARLGLLEGRVARVELAHSAHGTGFLVGPDLLLTAYSVARPLIDGHVLPVQVEARFDFRQLPDGSLSRGVKYSLATEWLVDYSPFTPAEGSGAPGSVPPTLDELDYALLRLAEPAGRHTVGGGSTAALRGWIEPPRTVVLPPGAALVTLDHAQSSPLRLFYALDAATGFNGNGTRLLHRLETAPGSSGAPLFDANLELVALHHARLPDGLRQAVPITAIAARLAQWGIDLSAPTAAAPAYAARGAEPPQQAAPLPAPPTQPANDPFSLGMAALAEGRGEVALTFFEQMRRDAEGRSDLSGQGEALLVIADALARLGRSGEAEKTLAQAADLFAEAQNPLGAARASIGLGNLARTYGGLAAALAHFGRALERVPDPHSPVRGVALSNRGLVRFEMGDRAAALQDLTAALEISRVTGDRREEAAALGNLGMVYNAQGDQTAALDAYQAALDAYRAVGDLRGEAATLNNMGMAYRSLRRLEQAQEALRQAEAQAERLGDRSLAARARNNLGLSLADGGGYAAAVAEYTASLELARGAGDVYSEAMVLNNLGSAYLDLNEPDKAAGFLEQALELQQRVGNRVGEAQTLANLGNVRMAQRRPGEARKLLEEALAILNAAGEQQGAARAGAGLAAALLADGDAPAAARAAQAAHDAAERAGDPAAQAAALLMLGHAQAALGDPSAAHASLAAARDLFTQLGDTAGAANAEAALTSLGSL